MSFLRSVALVAAACAAMVTEGSGQAGTLTASQRAAAIEGVAREIEGGYVFAEVGKNMAAAVRERAARGEYDAVRDGGELARLLTHHLREVGNDLHVAVHYSPEAFPAQPAGTQEPAAGERARFERDLARGNYGFRRLEILPGNIGYVRFDLFAPPELAGDTYAAAMAFVAGTDALIIDLRENGGSISPDAIPMLATYFFERPTHLIDLKWNTEDRPRQLWTWAHVPGRRYLDRPVYILTSRRTFSGAEEFAYDLKNLERAVIVGDTTGGGANPGGTRRLSDHFEVFVPFGRVTSPVTGTNWEGVGVIPDVAVSPAKALLVAQAEAIRAVRASATDERQRAELEQAEGEVQRKLEAFRRVPLRLEGYPEAREVFVAGAFNGWSPRATRMERQGEAWVAEVEVEPGRHAYKFIVDDTWMLDPTNPVTEPDGEHMNSVIRVE